MSNYICRYCNSVRKNFRSLSGHEKSCRDNPNRVLSVRNTGKKYKTSKPQSAESITDENIFCSLGCGNFAKYVTKNGSYLCDTNVSKCPNTKRKISKAHEEGKIPGWNDLSSSGKINRGWAKDLTKETNDSVLRMSVSRSGVMKGKPGRKHTIETKRKLSEKRIHFLENNSSWCEWYDVSGVKVQGNLELKFAEFLLKCGLVFSRKRIKYNVHRTYTPDFYIPKYDLYVEVKGFLYEKDKAKMKAVLSENEIDLRIIFKDDIDKLLEEAQIFSFTKASSILENIDYNVFENRWGVDGN